MKHVVSRDLYGYWDRLRKGRSAPERAEIDPAAIRGVLPDAFILGIERTERGREFPVRLSGTRLNALFLSDLKNRSFPDLWLPEDRPAVTRLLETVLDDAAPVVAGLRGTPDDHRPVDLEMVLLPLRHQGRTHTRLLGAIAPVLSPSWLGLVALEHVALTSLRLLGSEESVMADRRRPVAPAPEADELLGRRVGRFVVHQGGR